MVAHPCALQLDLELPLQDSNLDQGFQRPLCCHYTKGQKR
jgi:hypothetical protein